MLPWSFIIECLILHVSKYYVIYTVFYSSSDEMKYFIAFCREQPGEVTRGEFYNMLGIFAGWIWRKRSSNDERSLERIVCKNISWEILRTDIKLNIFCLLLFLFSLQSCNSAARSFYLMCASSSSFTPVICACLRITGGSIFMLERDSNNNEVSGCYKNNLMSEQEFWKNRFDCFWNKYYLQDGGLG